MVLSHIVSSDSVLMVTRKLFGKANKNASRRRVSWFKECLKNEQECFIVLFLSGFRPNETCAASFLNGFKNIPGKASVSVYCFAIKKCANANYYL